jgi:hypothetical protein
VFLNCNNHILLLCQNPLLTKEQKAYIHEIYNDFERLPEDSDGYQFRSFAHSHKNYYNNEFEKVME